MFQMKQLWGIWLTALLIVVGLLSHLCFACDHHHNDENNSNDNDHHHHNLRSTTTQAGGIHLSGTTSQRHLPQDTDNVVIEDCGFQEPTAEEIRKDKLKMKLWSLRNDEDAVIDYTIPVYAHVIQPSATEDIVPDSNVLGYISYLNSAFAVDTPFVFNLVNISRIVQPTWSNDCRTYETDYKTLLKIGNKESMNVYFCNSVPNGPGKGFLAGFTYSPSLNVGVKDGIVIARSNPTDLRRPNTLVHETGHFLGLYHTFSGDCTPGQNDLVDDTPQHISNTTAVNCKSDPSTWDTCPTLPGLDPIDNYMTYSNDNLCRTRFTPGQVVRMKMSFEIYRYKAPPIAPTPPTTAPVPTSTTISPAPLSNAPQPGSAPTTGDKCRTLFRTCERPVDCCRGHCREFLFFPATCTLL